MIFKQFADNAPFAVEDGIRYTLRGEGGWHWATARVAARHLAAESAEIVVTEYEANEKKAIAAAQAVATRLRLEAGATVPQARALVEADDTDEELILAMIRIRIRDEATWDQIRTGMVMDRPLSRRRADWTRPERPLTEGERLHLGRLIQNAVGAIRPMDPEEEAAWADVY